MFVDLFDGADEDCEIDKGNEIDDEEDPEFGNGRLITPSIVNTIS